ncbi:MAG: O-antigen ligase family protein, partial [Planctomycetaceae bacterium]|nr:O-antigen ligase family protein [Planctomycetaceae bacterium]
TIPWLARVVGRFPTEKSPEAAPRPSRFRLPHEAVWLGLGVTVVLLLGGLLASMSRGAWLGTVCGTAATIGLVGRSWLRRGGIVWLMAGLVVAAVLLSWLNLQAELGDRLSSLSQTEQTLSGRWNLWRDAVRIVPDFWQVGSGLGTFGFVQPQYQTGPMRVWFDQAENLFLQAFVEAGVGGGLLLIAVVVLALLSLRPLWRAAGDSVSTAVAGFAVFAIVGQVACASFDFSLRYPANQWALALVVGSALGFADRLRRPPTLPNQTVSTTRRLAASGLHAALLAGLLAARWEVAWARGVDLALVRGETEFDEQGMSSEDIDDALTGLRILLRNRPDDAEARLRTAGLQVVRYRQAAFRELKEELGAELPDADLWALTSPQVLHARAAEFALTADAVSLDELRKEPIIHEQLRPALDEAWRARQAGPLLPGSHRLLAQLMFLTDDPLADAPHIRRATMLMPQNPEVRHWAGRMHWDAGRVPEALAEWQRCLSLAAEYDDDIFETVAGTVPVERVIVDLLPDSLAALLRIADRPSWLDFDAEVRTRLGDKLQAIVDSTPAASLPAGEWEYAQGRTSQLHDDLEAARAQLQRATALDPERIEWRLMLAIVLRDLGETRDAIREAQACVRLAPDNPVAQALLQSLMAAELNRPRRVAP